MGLAAAGTVAVAVLVATTLVPAVLGFAGERLRPAVKRGRFRRHWPEERAVRVRGSWGLAWARLIGRAPALVLMACIAGLLVLALPARHLQLGLPGNESEPASSTQHQSYDLLAEGFGPGLTPPLPSSTPPASRRPAGRRSSPNLRPSCATIRT
jgi:RND superfamily putative drug exporter